MAKPVIALIGAGQMGSSHARIVAESADADLGLVVDLDAVAGEKLASRHWARVTSSLDEALKADAVVVASSSSSHLACAMPFVEAGLPTFVEKPLAPALKEVDELLDAAARHDTPLMCGFVERFNAAFRAAAEHLTAVPTHVLTVRHSPPAPRIRSSVVSDLLLHDIDLVLHLFGGADAALAGAACHQDPGSEFTDIADCTLSFPSGLANLSANRIGQRKVRSLTVHSSDELIEVDLLRQDVTVYRNVSQEIIRGGGGVGYRSSTEVDIPFVRHVGEPLALQFAHFLTLVNGRGDHARERALIRPPHVLMDAIESTPVPILDESTGADKR